MSLQVRTAREFISLECPLRDKAQINVQCAISKVPHVKSHACTPRLSPVRPHESTRGVRRACSYPQKSPFRVNMSLCPGGEIAAGGCIGGAEPC
eukprot:scaffold1243_cov403-Prasinococcus_capsulatus_cf.AAC.25